MTELPRALLRFLSLERRPFLLQILPLLAFSAPFQAQITGPQAFRYQRQVQVPPGTQQNVCTLLDATVFAHANPLADLRLYSAEQREIPYTITFSGTAPTGDSARILNLNPRSPLHLAFDLGMPARAYSAIVLNLNAQDFLASAKLTGLTSLSDKNPVYLGTFTLFDLTSQRLGHNSSLQFAESAFPYVHVELALKPSPSNQTLGLTSAVVTSAEVPPSRLAQTLYTPVAKTSALTQRARESVATFLVPAHVPVERITFELDLRDHTNFSRTVTLTSRPTKTAQFEPAVEQLSGQISRLSLTEAGQGIHEESLSFPAILASNEQSPATIEVAVQNGDDQPIRIRGVYLEMRQRKLCFPVPATQGTLMYGDPAAAAPVYDFGRFFNVAAPTRTAVLDPETLNPAYMAPAGKRRPIMERHPQLLAITLLLLVSIVAFSAFSIAKRAS